MILRYKQLSQHPRVFQSMTGLRVPEFDELFQEVLPMHMQAYQQHLEAQRQQRRQPPRVRAVGGGPAFTLEARDQMLLVVVWLRQYPTRSVGLPLWRERFECLAAHPTAATRVGAKWT